MSIYAGLLELARRQAALAEVGDMVAAIGLIGERAEFLANDPPATAADVDTLQAVISLDGKLASAIRQRMLAVRADAVSLGHGRTALVGYRPPLGVRPSRRLNAAG